MAGWIIILLILAAGAAVLTSGDGSPVFGMEAPGTSYYPSFIESIVTIGIIAAHVLFFVLIAKYFPIFEHHPETVDYTIPDKFKKTGKGHALPAGKLAGEA